VATLPRGPKFVSHLPRADTRNNAIEFPARAPIVPPTKTRPRPSTASESSVVPKLGPSLTSARLRFLKELSSLPLAAMRMSRARTGSFSPRGSSASANTAPCSPPARARKRPDCPFPPERPPRLPVRRQLPDAEMTAPAFAGVDAGRQIGDFTPRTGNRFSDRLGTEGIFAQVTATLQAVAPEARFKVPMAGEAGNETRPDRHRREAVVLAGFTEADDGRAGEDDPTLWVHRDAGGPDRRMPYQGLPVGAQGRRQAEVGFDHAPVAEAGVEVTVGQKAENPHCRRPESATPVFQQGTRVFGFGEDRCTYDQQPSMPVDREVTQFEPRALCRREHERAIAAEGLAGASIPIEHPDTRAAADEKLSAPAHHAIGGERVFRGQLPHAVIAEARIEDRPRRNVAHCL
jgi:hypothetical protein